jgi:GntR family transcriptional regulator / MocR family aminotransferase
VISAWCPPRTEASSTTASLRACALREAIADHEALLSPGHDEDLLRAAASAADRLRAQKRAARPRVARLLHPRAVARVEHQPADQLARILPVPVDAEGLDVELGARRAGEARLAYVTPSHQYPLGVPMSLPRRLALLRWASRARAWVIEDDYDSEFRYGARPMPCLHGLDVDGRVIYVGSFSNTLFPSLRLGFLVVPPDLQDGDQTVLADFIVEGHFARHLRRMRVAYRERLEAMTAAAERYCGGALRVRPTRTGLHAIADLEGVDAGAVSREAAAPGVEATALAAYFAGREKPANALVLGFAAVRLEAARRGMERLAGAIEAARRRGSPHP